MLRRRSRSRHDETSEAAPPEAEAPEGGPALAPPDEFVVDLVETAQVVLLGDVRHVAQHLEFVAELLPRLAEADVDFAWEFTNTRAQADLDALLADSAWSDDRCADLFVDLMGVGFGYREYADVLRSAWEINRSGRDAPFRVVALGIPSYVEDPDLLDGRSGAETDLRNWWLGGDYRDVTAVHMSNVMTNEVLRAGRRAVVYADADRTTTRALTLDAGRPVLSPGNLLHNWMGEGIRRVLFHGAEGDDAALARTEALVAAAPDQSERFGIDLDFSTLGNVRAPSVRAVVGADTGPHALGDLADGFLHLGNRADWRPVSLLEPFLRPDNEAAAEARYRALDPQDEPYERAELDEIRTEGHRAIAESWPPVPDPDED